ncbi:hypothetical protein MSG28_010915 [Choristoneura fumiferana]|uniref:Uncharacterized protein n=1 Tax=Choristoneura fumiferana TaxID=7141 RepID=A0ACC0KP88_CHOFU|nr:hypothetical protein MSG28_010915 [Choristoneura fumiferana]
MAMENNSLMPSQRVEKRVKLIPPDGGWGWMVLLGTAVSNIFNQSMLSLFSLLYGDHLEAMGHNTSGAAIVLSTMLFVANFGGPIAGAALKMTSPRMVAVGGMGLGFIQNSSFVAINSYFKLKKSRAVGLANVGTGVGQTLMPHLVRYLLENYGYQGACLLLSGLSLHGKVANMDKQQTANCMSAVALSDIAGRLVLPVFQDKYRIKARWMLIMTSVWLIVVRQVLAYQSSPMVLLAMSSIYGFGRSMVIVARNIAIAEHVRMDQVPAAVGLGMLTMGIIVPPTGYFLGWIRDYTDSFVASITAQNILLVILLVTWIPDMILMMMKEKQQKKKELEQIQLT